MKFSRRDLLRWSAAGGAVLIFSPRLGWTYSFSPLQLDKFIIPLPGLGPSGIPVAVPDTTSIPGVDVYRMESAQFTHSFHPNLPPSKVWGYADATVSPNHGYLGGVIVARTGRPVKLIMQNKLPPVHPLPVDKTLPGAEPSQAENRETVHLHGGFVPWLYDGGPFSWFAPNGDAGVSCLNQTRAGTAEYFYPNDQSARLVWYHDHAIGITRLNAYAGLASAYVLRDDFEDSLVGKFVPTREVPLIIQDKSFVDGTDVNYTRGGVGDLWYPYKYEPDSDPTGRWAYGPNEGGTVIGPLPVPSIVPEMFADTTIINGAAYPFVNVEPRHYRFRMLNGSQARFYNLQLYFADGTGLEADLTKAGPAFIQIGTEGGFLPAPVMLNSPPRQFGVDPITGLLTSYTLLLAPAERADVIIDFSKVPVGSKLILYSDAPAPFPFGDPRNDFFTGNPDFSGQGGAPSTVPGFGPNTRTLMQFRVVPRQGAADNPMLNVLANIARGNQPNSILQGVAPLSPKSAVKTRNLTLNEDFDDYGRLIQRLGTDVQNGVNNQGLPTWSRNYEDITTENPKAGTVEVWNIFNLTGDTHPIHFHLVNVQVLSRRPFDPTAWDGTPTFTGPARPPDANERGFKETVRMNPGEVTTVIAKFDLPNVPFAIPSSPRTGGHEYVWHCHILEHEEHDMMRPLVVQP